MALESTHLPMAEYSCILWVEQRRKRRRTGQATCVRYSTQGGWTQVWSYLSCWDSSLLAGMANSTVDQEYRNPPNGGFLYWERKYSKIIVINPSICCDSVALWTDGIPGTVDYMKFLWNNEKGDSGAEHWKVPPVPTPQHLIFLKQCWKNLMNQNSKSHDVLTGENFGGYLF